MIRKIIWGLLISVFFIGFVLSGNSSARPWPIIVVWADPSIGNIRILPGYEAPVGDSASERNSQIPTNNGESNIGANERSHPLHLEINRIIGGWLNPFYSKSKEIIKK
jgi:hypothetical protein